MVKENENDIMPTAEGKNNISYDGNKIDKDCTLHTIGCGDSKRSANAVQVMQNGDTYIIGIGGFDGTNYKVSKTVQEAYNELLEAFNELKTIIKK